MNKKIVASVLLVAILFASAIAGTIVYYNGVLNNKNSKIALMKIQIPNLSSQISSLNDQLTNLTSQVTHLTSPNLVTALGIKEVSNTSSISRSYNRLYIEGYVTNAGTGTAFNAGLHVAAYAADGTLEINMTFPIGSGDFGTSYAINSYVQSFDPVFTSLKFGNLASGQIVNVHLNIYHEGIVSNWIVTPVSKNAPQP